MALEVVLYSLFGDHRKERIPLRNKDFKIASGQFLPSATVGVKNECHPAGSLFTFEKFSLVGFHH